MNSHQVGYIEPYRNRIGKRVSTFSAGLIIGNGDTITIFEHDMDFDMDRE